MPSPKVPCPMCGKMKSAKADFCRQCAPPYERTAERRAALSEKLKGTPKPWLRGRKRRPEVGRKIAAWWTPERREEARQRGLLFAESREWLLRIAEALSGENNPNYQGKGQATAYAPGWGRGYRAKLRQRTSGVCELCGKTSAWLDLHHRDFSKTNHDPENIAVLCRSCHKLLHFANSART